MRTIPNVTLNNGVEMPILGFGVFQIPPGGDRAGRRDGARGRLPAHRHRRLLRQRGGRRPGHRRQRHPPRASCSSPPSCGSRTPGEANAKRAFEQSLERLGLDHLDLYLIHQPLGDYYSSWRAMEELHGEGRARAIGVVQLLPRPARRPHRAQRGHPGGQPDRDPPVLPAHDRPGAHARARRADRVVGPFAEGSNNLFTDPILTDIGDAHGKSVAQVVLRWLIQRDVVVIPKSVRRERMEQNFDVFDFDLTDDEMARIATLDTGASLVLRPPRPGDGQLAQQPPRHLNFPSTGTSVDARSLPFDISSRIRRQGSRSCPLPDV